MQGPAKQQRVSAAMIPATTGERRFRVPWRPTHPVRISSLAAQLVARVQIEPFNALATAIFVLAILHTFAAARFAAVALRVQRAADDARRRRRDRRPRASGLRRCTSSAKSRSCSGCGRSPRSPPSRCTRAGTPPTHYLNDTVNYTEPLFVVVIMALASTRPVIGFAESALRRVASARRRHAGGVVGDDPDHRPAARLVHHRTGGDDDLRAAARRASSMICEPSPRLKYATLGLLFVNISIGGTLTHFAAPPVLMVARAWEWDTPFMLPHFGWRAIIVDR